MLINKKYRFFFSVKQAEKLNLCVSKEIFVIDNKQHLNRTVFKFSKEQRKTLNKYIFVLYTIVIKSAPQQKESFCSFLTLVLFRVTSYCFFYNF